MQFIETEIPGCYEMHPQIMTDNRGKFVKTFHCELFKEKGLETNFVEEYFSVSTKRVLRGMHFQLPPHAHVKLVYCIDGEVLDVLIDLRVDSPAYGKPIKFNLSSIACNILYIPIGIAHGFYTLSNNATMVYKTSSVHNANSDAGILWKSFDVWSDNEPILSNRDQNHPLFDNFINPFTLR